MSEDDLQIQEELFKDLKFYVVGDIDQKVHLKVLAIHLTLAFWLILDTDWC